MARQRQTPLSTRLKAWFSPDKRGQRIAQIASGFVILVGCLVLLGWSLHLTFLKGIIPDTATMKANTALCLVLAGASLGLQTRHRRSLLITQITQACAIAVGLVGLLTLCQYLWGLNFGIDELLFQDDPPSLHTSHPGRMGVNTAINFVLTSIALWLTSHQKKQPQRQFQQRIFDPITIAQGLAVISGFIALQAIIGYAYNIQGLYQPSLAASSMALHTALSFGILSVGVLALHSHQGLMRTVTTHKVGGVVARQFLPAAILIPLVLGWLILRGERAGWYNSSFRLSLMVMSLVIVSVSLIWCSATMLNRLDRDRIRVMEQLRLSEERLQLALQGAGQGTWDWDLKLNVLTWDERCKAIFGLPPDLPVSYEWHLNALHPDDRQPVADAAAIALRDHTEFDQEYRTFHSNGTMRWVRARGRGYYDVEGQPYRMLGTVLDITERKEAGAAFQRKVQEAEAAQQTLNALMEYIPEGITIADAPDVTIRQVSQYGQQLTGRPPEAIQGIPVEEHASNWGIFYPDGVTPAANEALPLTRAVQQGEVVINEEWMLRRPDGQQIVMLCNAGPIYNSNGEITGGIIAWRDISERKRYELALKEKEQQLQDLCNSMPQFVWTSNAQGELQYVNRRWVEYSGLTVEQSQNPENIAACYHPDDVQLAFQRWATALETKQPCEFEGRLRAFDGSYRWFLTRIVPVFDDQGQVLRWYGTSTDITELRQAEAALRQSEDRYRMAMTSAKLGTWDWDLTTDELNWDAACKAMFGLSPEARINMDVFYAALHPDDCDRVNEVVQNALTPDSSGSYDIEYRTVGIEDGIERWIAAKGQVYFSLTGQPVRFIGTVLDITEIKRYESERQRAETQLRDRQERLEAALFAAGTGTFRWDIRTNALTWDENLDRLFRLPPGETVRSLDAFIQLVHPDDRQGVIDRCAHCVREGADLDMDFRVVYPNGTVRWLSDKGKTFFDESSNPVYMTGACVDITDRKRAEAALQQQTEALIQANRLKDEFLAMLSHELRTPLNPILGWTKLLKEQKLTSTKAAEALNVIERSTKQQLSLVNDLLDVSAIIQGQLNLEVDPVDLTVIVNTAIETVQFAAQAKDITVDALQIDSKTSEAMLALGDSGRLRQVFWNLLANAVKFTPEGGRVEVTLSRIINANGHHYAQVSITDSGIGISPEFLPWVFDHFRQADGSMTRRHGGLGLGLSIVRHIVELHGGTVTAASPGVGQGSTFTIKLPLGGASEASRKSKPPISIAGSSAPSSAWTSNSSPSPATPLNGIQILVVDDDLDNLELLRFLLQEYGAIVTAVNSAQKALQIISDAPPDLIISDIGMPEINGYEFIRQVRALPQGQQIPVLAFTAFADQEEQEQILASGFQTHLSKPVDPFKLLDVLAQWATI